MPTVDEMHNLKRGETGRKRKEKESEKGKRGERGGGRGEK